MELWGLKNCDTCRKAMKALDAKGTAYTFHDIRDGSLTKKQVTDWAKAVGADTILNKKSTTWRGLSDAEKAGAETQAGLVRLLLAHPALIKRPVIVQGSKVSVGPV